jgi:L-lactate dehydrogenase complex protein LldG
MPSDDRAAVFARIREALRTPAPHWHVGHVGDHPAVPDEAAHAAPGADQFRAWLPLVGSDREEQIALFAANSVQLKAEFIRAASLAEAGTHLGQLAKQNGWLRVATHRHPLAEPLAASLDLPRLVVDDGFTAEDLERCDASLTGCDCLVAQTGSILVSGPSAGGRALSVLPPHHVVVAREDQLVPDLAAALRQARERHGASWPSFLSFITGSSRTGDIERILVLGAHGPKRLTVFLLP